MTPSVLAECKTTKTYVMKGDFNSKELETYHLILAPSYACNLGCSHCYLPDHAAETIPEERVLFLIDEWSEIVMRERGQYGGIFHLKGGEPLILPYFDKVIEKISGIKTLRFMMTTNGIYYNDNTIEQLIRLNESIDGNVSIIVSLDGSTDEINAILRRPGSYKKTIGFVRKLAYSGITFFLNYVVHRRNLDDIPDFMNLARELGAAQVNFLSFVPKGYGSKLANYRPDPLEVFNKIHAVWENGDDDMRDMLAGSLSDILNQEACGNCTATECVGGYRGLFYIVPNSDVYSCPNLNFPQLKVGNIIESSCSELIDTVSAKVYEHIRTAPSELCDRFLCKGERFLPHFDNYLITEITDLQREFIYNMNCNSISRCFSRNF